MQLLKHTNDVADKGNIQLQKEDCKESMRALPLSKSYRAEFEAYQCFIRGHKIPLRHLLVLTAKSCLNLIEMAIRYIPGGFGYKLRYLYYKPLLKHLGENTLIGTGVFLNGPGNISIGDYVWIDDNCRIEAMLGKVIVGKRVHIAPYTLIFAHETITIGDYVGLSSFVRIYSSSEYPCAGKRMSGPMVPPELRATRVSPITLHKDSFVGTGSVLLPGAELEEGAVVGANSVVSKKVASYSIVAGAPAKFIGKRPPISATNI